MEGIVSKGQLAIVQSQDPKAPVVLPVRSLQLCHVPCTQPICLSSRLSKHCSSSLLLLARAAAQVAASGQASACLAGARLISLSSNGPKMHTCL